MHIRNVRVYREDKSFAEGDIYIKDGLFAEPQAVCGDQEESVDGEGGYAIPGLIDIHFHGCMGYDFCDGTQEAIKGIGEYEGSVGGTGINPGTKALRVVEMEVILGRGGG